MMNMNDMMDSCMNVMGSMMGGGMMGGGLLLFLLLLVLLVWVVGLVAVGELSFWAVRRLSATRDDEGRYGVCPPEAEQGVGPETDEQGGREVGTKHVLLALALGGRGAKLLADLSLGNSQRRHGHECECCEPDPHP